MPETACAPQTLLRANGKCSFPPVAPDELGFALSVFVAASSGALAVSPSKNELFTEEELIEREQLFVDLLSRRVKVDSRNILPHQATLDTAFTLLWNEYCAHELRDSLCARVLCFHFLMERTEGRAVERWMTACPERPEEVLLHPCVVEGLAKITLDAGTGLSEEAFCIAIAQAHQLHCST